MRKSVGSSSLLALSVPGLLLAAGCGGDGPPPPMPSADVGSYAIMVEANGKTDSDQMNISVGSNQNVLLTFVWGFSEVRGTLAGSTQLTVPRQKVTVNHPAGPADGVTTGEGTLNADGTVDITFHVTTPGYGPADGGSGVGGTGVVDYHITGMKSQ